LSSRNGRPLNNLRREIAAQVVSSFFPRISPGIYSQMAGAWGPQIGWLAKKRGGKNRSAKTTLTARVHDGIRCCWLQFASCKKVTPAESLWFLN
jgi:hypothetical protein